MINPSIPRLTTFRDYIELELCLKVYDLCDDNQFGHVSKLDFANFLNLRDTADKVYIKSKEKLRVCYLIWKLSETLPDDHARRSWRESVLQNLEIAPSYYKSHYSDVGGAAQTKDNKAFTEALKNLVS